MKRKYWIGLAMGLAIVGVLILVTGCNSSNPTNDTSTAAGGGTVAGGAAGGGGMSETGTTTEITTSAAVGGDVQYIGFDDGTLAGEIEAELGFTKARPLYDGYVYSLKEGFENSESHTDETGFVCKMEEFFVYPQIDDTAEEAQKFNKAMQARMRANYEEFAYHSTEFFGGRKGCTYRAYRHQDLVSIVFVEWVTEKNSQYAGAFTYVYDTTNAKFLNKKEIVARAGFQDFAFSERFDAWYASGNPSPGHDTRRLYAPGLLQMWAYDYHLPFGDWVDRMTQMDMDTVINAGVVAERYPEYGLFFDDSGDLTLIRTKFEVKDAESENPYFSTVVDAESANWLNDMPYATVELEVFQTLAQKVGGDRSKTQAFVVYLGNKDDPERIIRKLAAASEIPEMNLNLHRLMTHFESMEGYLEMYLIIPRYENSVLGLEPSSGYWQDYSSFGPVIAVKDERECFLSYVYRGHYTSVVLKNDGEKSLLDAANEEGIFVDVSEHIGQEGNITEEIDLFVKGFCNPYNQKDSNQ